MLIFLLYIWNFFFVDNAKFESLIKKQTKQSSQMVKLVKLLVKLLAVKKKVKKWNTKKYLFGIKLKSVFEVCFNFIQFFLFIFFLQFSLEVKKKPIMFNNSEIA